jgi:hypothetical protein
MLRILRQVPAVSGINQPFLRFHANAMRLLPVLTILLLLCIRMGKSNPADSLSGEYPMLPARVGEHCTVGGDPLSEKDVALIVRGRRVPLNRLAVQHFLDHQEKYFSRFEPKSALFQEDMSPRKNTALGGISLGWFLFGLSVLTGLVFSGMSGYAAIAKGLDPRLYFFLGFFLGPVGFLYVMTRPGRLHESIPGGLVKVPETSSPVPCPACGALNHPTARVCASCHTALNPVGQSEAERVLTH